jgi:hypothetical protein
MKNTINLLKFAAIVGNILFVLWILFNGISEGFVGTTLEKISYLSLMLLLVTNSILLLVNSNSQKVPD